MASGLPCVIADGGGSASLVQHGISGFKCSPQNPLEYVHFLRSVIEDGSLRSKFKKEGLQFVSRLDWNRLSQQYFLDIQQLALQKHRSGLAWAN